jgi:hypothetical protein
MLPDVSEKISYDCIFPRSSRHKSGSKLVLICRWERDEISRDLRQGWRVSVPPLRLERRLVGVAAAAE